MIITTKSNVAQIRMLEKLIIFGVIFSQVDLNLHSFNYIFQFILLYSIIIIYLGHTSNRTTNTVFLLVSVLLFTSNIALNSLQSSNCILLEKSTLFLGYLIIILVHVTIDRIKDKHTSPPLMITGTTKSLELYDRTRMNKKLESIILKMSHSKKTFTLFHICIENISDLDKVCMYKYKAKVTDSIERKLLSVCNESFHLGRINGGEYILLIESFLTDKMIWRLTNKVLKEFEKPIPLEKEMFTFSVAVTEIRFSKSI